MKLYVIALALVLVTVLGMLTIMAYVVMGAMTVGNLWSLLPLSIYAVRSGCLRNWRRTCKMRVQHKERVL